jgi:hypothetical protein
MVARQRLRSAARQSLTVPAFSAPADCTPWVIGDLWPAELANATGETVALAEYLNADLQRIADTANAKLQEISRGELAGSQREAAQARVVNIARAYAVLRVESTLRQLRDEPPQSQAEYLGVTSARPAEPPQPPAPVQTVPPVDPADARPTEPAEIVLSAAQSDDQLLRRLLEFVARQEPRLRWGAGIDADGTPVLVTDLAHGWIPSGIQLPTGVRLLRPGRRTGDVTTLLGDATRVISYRPGDRLGWAMESSRPETSIQPRELPTVDDLGGLLAGATRREELPRIVPKSAQLLAAGAGVAEPEADLLRVHLDTARYQLLAQYPDTDGVLLLRCLLLAATAAAATGDQVAANYHFSWYRTLSGGEPAPMN